MGRCFVRKGNTVKKVSAVLVVSVLFGLNGCTFLGEVTKIGGEATSKVGDVLIKKGKEDDQKDAAAAKAAAEKPAIPAATPAPAAKPVAPAAKPTKAPAKTAAVKTGSKEVK